jgi:hypothetical protein
MQIHSDVTPHAVLLHLTLPNFPEEFLIESKLCTFAESMT